MSAAFFIALDRDDPEFDTTVNGKFLAHDTLGLDAVAKELGVRSPDEYVSYSPEESREMMADIGSGDDEIDSIDHPEQVWYDPVEGLDWVARLSEHVRANPSAVTNAAGVLSDLDEYRDVLEQARAVGARWCLHVDF